MNEGNKNLKYQQKNLIDIEAKVFLGRSYQTHIKFFTLKSWQIFKFFTLVISCEFCCTQNMSVVINIHFRTVASLSVENC